MDAIQLGYTWDALCAPYSYQGRTSARFDALRETWVNRLKPRDPAEDELVSEYVNAVWLHRRADRALFHYLKAGIEQAAGREKENVAGDIRAPFADAQGHHSLYAIFTAAFDGPTTSHPSGDTTRAPIILQQSSTGWNRARKVVSP